MLVDSFYVFSPHFFIIVQGLILEGFHHITNQSRFNSIVIGGLCSVERVRVGAGRRSLRGKTQAGQARSKKGNTGSVEFQAQAPVPISAGGSLEG
jgi:hypothetical protein